MTNRAYFGTDGVRGPYGGPVINDDFAARLGFAAAAWWRSRAEEGATRSKSVLIGRDTRFSGNPLEAAIARGLRAGGLEPVSLGVLPTPAVARAVRQQHAALGIVITASHNPASDNGIKFFGPSGVKLTDADEWAIEQELPDRVAGSPAPFAAIDAVHDYVATMQSLLPANALAGWRVVLDTANGATCMTSPHVLRALGATVSTIGDAPDGRNINAGVGSEFPANLAGHVRAERAQLGIAHDGDGDRCVLCDETGDVLDGDEILTLLAIHALQQGRLTRNGVVITVQSNLGVDAAIGAAGGRVVRTPVGDRYVIERMLTDGFSLGGETSGHVIWSEISPTGDGLVAALKVIEAMLATGKPLSELRRALVKLPQATAALMVREKKPLESLPTLRTAIVALETELATRGRVLVRWSGTEPKLRFLVEGPTEQIVRAGMDRLREAARADLAID